MKALQVNSRHVLMSLPAKLNKLAKAYKHGEIALCPYNGDSNFFGQSGQPDKHDGEQQPSQPSVRASPAGKVQVGLHHKSKTFCKSRTTSHNCKLVDT